MNRRGVDPRGICVRLGFRGYRVFLASPAIFHTRANSAAHMLHYHNYDLAQCDLVAETLGYFPNAKEIGKWDLDIALSQNNGILYRLAFVNNLEYECLYKTHWYEEYLKKRESAK